MHAGPSRPAYSREFDSPATALKARVGELSDDRIILELSRIVTLLGDGHSGIYGPRQGTPLRLVSGSLPLRFYEFADGVFVIDAVETNDNGLVPGSSDSAVCPPRTYSLRCLCIFTTTMQWE